MFDRVHLYTTAVIKYNLNIILRKKLLTMVDMFRAHESHKAAVHLTSHFRCLKGII